MVPELQFPFIVYRQEFGHKPEAVAKSRTLEEATKLAQVYYKHLRELGKDNCVFVTELKETIIQRLQEPEWDDIMYKE